MRKPSLGIAASMLLATTFITSVCRVRGSEVSLRLVVRRHTRDELGEVSKLLTPYNFSVECQRGDVGLIVIGIVVQYRWSGTNQWRRLEFIRGNQGFNGTLDLPSTDSSVKGVQFRLLQWEHGGGNCNCWTVEEAVLLVKNSAVDLTELCSSSLSGKLSFTYGSSNLESSADDCGSSSYSSGNHASGSIDVSGDHGSGKGDIDLSGSYSSGDLSGYCGSGNDQEYSNATLCGGTASNVRGFVTEVVPLSAVNRDSLEACPQDSDVLVTIRQNRQTETCTTPRIEVSYTLNINNPVPHCGGPDGEQEGIEFAMRRKLRCGGYNRWVPLRLTQRQFKNITTTTITRIRGYNVEVHTVQAESVTVTEVVTICGEPLLHDNASEVQFRWMNTVGELQGDTLDTWAILNATADFVDSDENMTTIFEAGNYSLWEAIRNGDVTCPPCNFTLDQTLPCNLTFGYDPQTSETVQSNIALTKTLLLPRNLSFPCPSSTPALSTTPMPSPISSQINSALLATEMPPSLPQITLPSAIQMLTLAPSADQPDFSPPQATLSLISTTFILPEVTSTSAPLTTQNSVFVDSETISATSTTQTSASVRPQATSTPTPINPEIDSTFILLRTASMQETTQATMSALSQATLTPSISMSTAETPTYVLPQTTSTPSITQIPTSFPPQTTSAPSTTQTATSILPETTSTLSTAQVPTTETPTYVLPQTTSAPSTTQTATSILSETTSTLSTAQVPTTETPTYVPQTTSAPSTTQTATSILPETTSTLSTAQVPTTEVSTHVETTSTPSTTQTATDASELILQSLKMLTDFSTTIKPPEILVTPENLRNQSAKERGVIGSALLSFVDQVALEELPESGNLSTESITIKSQLIFADTEGYTIALHSNDFYNDMPRMSIEIPSELVKIFANRTSGAVRVISALYYNVENLFPGGKPGEKDSVLGPGIVSAALQCGDSFCNSTEVTLNDPVRILIEHSKENSNNETECVFWEFLDNSLGQWSNYGCNKSNKLSNDSFTMCECNHLTHFAILLSPVPLDFGEDVELSLTFIGYIGTTISLVTMTITALIFICIKSLHNMRNYIHIHLCINLMIAQLIFVVGIDKSAEDYVPVHCQAIAVVLHYFFLVSFMWMLMEGVVLYVALVLVFAKHKKFYFLAFTLASYGIPFLYMGLLTLPLGFGLQHDDHYGSMSMCFLNPETHFIWAFIAPVVVIIMMNFVLFLIVARITWKHQKRRVDKTKTANVRRWLRSAVLLVVVMGITWIIGVLVMEVDALLPLAYIFTIIVAFQGLAIFLIFVVFSKQVRESVKKLWKVKVKESTILNNYFFDILTFGSSSKTTGPTSATSPPQILKSANPTSPLQSSSPTSPLQIPSISPTHPVLSLKSANPTSPLPSSRSASPTSSLQIVKSASPTSLTSSLRSASPTGSLQIVKSASPTSLTSPLRSASPTGSLQIVKSASPTSLTSPLRSASPTSPIGSLHNNYKSSTSLLQSVSPTSFLETDKIDQPSLKEESSPSQSIFTVYLNQSYVSS